MQTVKKLATIINTLVFFFISIAFLGVIEEYYKLKYELTNKQLEACMNIDMKEE